MRSDPSRRGTPLARLADVLARASDGAGPTPVELAEVLWLAEQERARSAGGRAQAPDDEAPRSDLPPSSHADASADQDPVAPTEPTDDERVPLYLPAPPAGSGDEDGAPAPRSAGASARPSDGQHTPGTRGGARPATAHATLRVPVPPMVTHPLALQRALRPLKRRVPSPVGHVLDEEATAHRIARLGARPWDWLPVLRPAEERWLRLSLVYDAGPTMPVWRPLVRELHTALVQSGIFRTVELHHAMPDGTVPPQAAAAPATGRTVTLLVSDCMGPQWREGAAGGRWYRTLRRWAERMPLAVIQPLPERLWRTTALPTTPGTLAAPHPAAPSGALTFTPYAAGPPPPGALPVPVLEAAPNWWAHWASLVADGSGVRLPGAVGWLGAGPAPARPADEPPTEDVTRLSPEDLVLRFRSTASAEAFRLAGHLAVGEPRLPVMRLVQAAVEARPRPQHLAEVILSGMLTVRSAADPESYAFRDGVREVLLRTLPRTARGRTRELLARAGESIDERAGVAPGELRAVAGVRGRGAGAGVGPGCGVAARVPEGEPFATVAPDTVRQLAGSGDGRPALGAAGPLFGGRYRGLEQIGLSGRVWRSEDVHDGGRTVVVQRFLRAPRWLRLDFTGAARRLAHFRHPHVAAVDDYGFHRQVPYLAMDFVEGRSLEDLLQDHPNGLPADQLMDLVPRLADAVAALHAADLAHGALTSPYVRLSPAGPVLCGFTLRPFDETSRADDLRALGRLVREMFEPRDTYGAQVTHAPRDTAEPYGPYEPQEEDPTDLWATHPASAGPSSDPADDFWGPDLWSDDPWTSGPPPLEDAPQGPDPAPADLLAAGRTSDDPWAVDPDAADDPWRQDAAGVPQSLRRDRPGTYTLTSEAAGRLASALNALRSEDATELSGGLSLLRQLSSPSLHGRTYSLLGPLRVTQPHGWTLSVTDPRSRAMLCILLLQEGHAVPDAELTAGIWGTDPPANAPRLLASTAARLREALGPDSVARTGDGYALLLASAADEVDLFRCRELAAQADTHRREGEIESALHCVESALDLWDDAPLENVPGPAGREARTELAELHSRLVHGQQQLAAELEESAGGTAELEGDPQGFAPDEARSRPAPHERFPRSRPDALETEESASADYLPYPATDVSFAYPAHPDPPSDDALQTLGRAVSHLLVRGGMGPERFEMRLHRYGWDVTVDPEVDALQVLLTTVDHLPAALAELRTPHGGFDPLVLTVTVILDPDRTAPAPPLPSGLRHLSDRPGTRAVVIVSGDLYVRLTRSGRIRATHAFEPVPQSDDWYCAIPAGPGDDSNTPPDAAGTTTPGPPSTASPTPGTPSDTSADPEASSGVPPAPDTLPDTSATPEASSGVPPAPDALTEAAAIPDVPTGLPPAPDTLPDTSTAPEASSGVPPAPDALTEAAAIPDVPTGLPPAPD
ncbi:SAV_2336 N-terminal domain-related protein, partial [Streptomyces sp. NPDC048518]|uniref:SAV_2336 N-terminal domain-related protein n=1 Tax=Streptomyces sp. NPDC048518 TaxID=3155029 RepID=UPI0033C7C025